MKRRIGSFVFAVLQLICLSGAARAAGEVDRYLETQIKNLHIPGASVAVVRNGTIVKSKGYGFADLQSKSPATPKTVYEIGSMTKQFTAVAVMMLVGRRKNLARRQNHQILSRTRPGLESNHRSASSDTYLGHSKSRCRAGLSGYFPHRNYGKNYPSREELLKEFYKLPSEFAPGETWAYDNTGYYLLGIIIEKASGKNYWQFLDERIFKPLGMNSTRNTDAQTIIPNRASGYGWVGDQLGKSSRAAAVYRFFRRFAFFDGRRFGEMGRGALHGKIAEKIESRKNVDAGAEPTTEQLAAFDYGFGWFIEKYRGSPRSFSTAAARRVFRPSMHRFVDDQLTVIILTNHADMILEQMALDIAGMYEPKLKYSAIGQDNEPVDNRKSEKRDARLSEGKNDAAYFTPAMRLHLKTATGKSFFRLVRFTREQSTILRFWNAKSLKRRMFCAIKCYSEKILTAFRSKLTKDGKIAQIYCW